MKATDALLRMDLRRNRAMSVHAHVMHIVEKYLCDHDPEIRGRRDCAEELWALFHDSGAEIVTDDMRADAGLRQRDGLGWTAEELQILEARRLEIMRRPLVYTTGNLEQSPVPQKGQGA